MPDVITSVYPLGKRKDPTMFKNLLKSFLGETTKAGDTVIDKPHTASSRLWIIALYTILVMANRKFDLGLSEQELMQLAGLVATYVTFKSVEDAWKRSAAIAKSAKERVEKPGPEIEGVPGLTRSGQ